MVCNSDLCPECKTIVADNYLRGRKMTVDEIKDKVNTSRMKQATMDLKLKLQQLTTCPCCGKKR